MHTFIFILLGGIISFLLGCLVHVVLLIGGMASAFWGGRSDQKNVIDLIWGIVGWIFLVGGAMTTLVGGIGILLKFAHLI